MCLILKKKSEIVYFTKDTASEKRCLKLNLKLNYSIFNIQHFEIQFDR